MTKKWSAIVHGGAGNISSRLEAAHRAGCRKAIEAAAEVLDPGGGALDAVVAAVRVLEDDPLFNAGVGAALDARGIATHDASICRASDLGYGAAATFCGVRNPVELARAVLEDGRHCLLAGPAALAFARARGLELVAPDFFVTNKSKATLETVRARAAAEGARESGEHGPPEAEGDTVGAVARDVHGEICAATSTGGLVMRMPGRVGDSPIAGHGTYACPDLGGLSATGHGETMMRTVFALTALQAMCGPDPTGALREALDAATARVGGRGGAIAILPDGTPVHARNTRGMSVAFQTAGTAAQTAFGAP